MMHDLFILHLFQRLACKHVKFLGTVAPFQQFIRMRLEVLLIFWDLVATFCDKPLASVEFSCGLVHKTPFSLFFLLIFFLTILRSNM